MIKAIKKYLGRGEFSITVPPMDGALTPNALLEESEEVLAVEAPDDLALMNGVPVVSSRTRILEIDGGGREFIRFESEISCLAGLPDGGLATALTDGSIILLNGSRPNRMVKVKEGMRCITAMQADENNCLWLTQGSSKNDYQQWKRDLMEKNTCGSLWCLEIASGKARQICQDLAFPYGLYCDGEKVLVSESWRSRLVKISLTGSTPLEEVFAHVPGYVSRFSPAKGGGFWLTVFAPRNQLIEFVLREKRYRKEMMETIDPDLWLAPTLRSNVSFLEPVQAGGAKQLGILKPWAPARSYGLIVRLDPEGAPVASLHSRADGSRHGITGCLEHNGRLLLAVKGEGMVASFPLDRLEKE